MRQVDGVISSTRWDILENVVFKSSYKTNKFEDMIKKASKNLSTYGNQISSFQGTVTGFDGEFEAQNLLKVIPPIKELFALNSLAPNPFERDEVMELGWDSTLTLIYVSLRRESGGTIYFSKGIAELSDAVPFDSQRTPRAQFLVKMSSRHLLGR